MSRRSLQKSRPIAKVPVPPTPQSGVIPYRRRGRGIEVLLITSNRRQRWTIPKGFVKHGLSPADSALQEAWEEAGISGDVSHIPVGWYVYTKRKMILSVAVFSMHVEKIFDVWPEWSRQRQWVSLIDSVALIEEAGLRNVVRKFGAAVSKSPVDA